MADFLPSKDAQLQQFATNFSAKITAAPTTYGLVAADATSLATLVTTYTSALASATNPTTRTKGTVAAKNTAKVQLTAFVRVLAKRIQANPAVTAQQKTDLGLPIKAQPSPIPPPTVQPALQLVKAVALTQSIRITDINTPKSRAKPTGVQGAEVYSFVPATPGAAVPPITDLEAWRFEGLATSADFTVDFKAEDLGKTATVVARWYNPKGEPGPVSSPITGTVAA